MSQFASVSFFHRKNMTKMYETYPKNIWRIPINFALCYAINTSMTEVTKGHNYLKKHSAFTCDFVKYVFWHFVTTRHQSVNRILKFCIACLIAYCLDDYNCFVYTFLLYFKVLLKKKRSVWIKLGRTERCWHKMVPGKAPDDEWETNFRIFWESFASVVEMI